ncbi:MAG: hypothetical protein PQJ44_06560 [Sphaerochaetaceae bacterium]|nr:hypothetical protein [Sphaerochaetaceae bacterium]
MINNLLVLLFATSIPLIICYFGETNRLIALYFEYSLNIKKVVMWIYITIFSLFMISTIYFQFNIDIENANSPGEKFILIAISIIIVCLIIAVIIYYYWLCNYKMKNKYDQFATLIDIFIKRSKKSKKNDNYIEEITSLIEYMFNEFNKDISRIYSVNNEKYLSILFHQIMKITTSFESNIHLDHKGIQKILVKLETKKKCKSKVIKKYLKLNEFYRDAM